MKYLVDIDGQRGKEVARRWQVLDSIEKIIQMRDVIIGANNRSCSSSAYCMSGTVKKCIAFAISSTLYKNPAILARLSLLYTQKN